MAKNNTKQKEYFLMLAAILLLAFVGGISWLSGEWQESRQAQTPKIIGEAALTIDFGGGAIRAFEGEIVENETLVDALTQASKAGNLSYKLNEKNELAAVGQFIAGNNKAWRWFLNNAEFGEPLDEVTLKPGDKILLKYE